MNRIYIIGNGFDLSHGLPTSYNDFIKFLIKKEFYNLIDKLPDKIKDIDLNHQFLGKLIIKDQKILDFKNYNSFIELGEYEKNYFNNLKNEFTQNPLSCHKKYFNINQANDFLKNILNSNHFLWGKIELQYFDSLLKLLSRFNTNNKERNHLNLVDELNKNLDFIKNELVSYLTYIQENNKIDYTESEVCELLNEKINPKTRVINSRNKGKIVINDKIDQNLFLNFNYTDTFSYLRKICNIHISNLNIHGNIKKSNDIIFGFGDENTIEYKQIENSEDVFLENIKSFKYLKNKNYDNLIGYIERNFYEVYLLGHSCSVTDRVLLKKIFENTNCLTIKIIPRHGNEEERYNNYKEICFNIARIFEDNGLMRDKVIPFEDCSISLPNIKKFEVNVFDYLKNNNQ